MSKIKIDREKCIRCGACIKDCITYSIESGKEGFPTVSYSGESRCISCQHCFAICPVGAITFDNNKPEKADSPISSTASGMTTVRKFSLK